MIYENAIKVINSVRTKKFRVTTSNGENKVMRLLYQHLIQFVNTNINHEAYGYIIPYSDVTSWVEY